MLNKIKQLIHNLPEEDIVYAEKFINNRDFESLKYLVDSVLEEEMNSEQSKLDTKELMTLQYYVAQYYSQFE